mmetsp:Transcript_58561/g.171354  ORF Transcript_58561/g.171354 Transcript_58561/m.171354 type:complete len:307 (+) Transcript_58561:870-1790(+)
MLVLASWYCFRTFSGTFWKKPRISLVSLSAPFWYTSQWSRMWRADSRISMPKLQSTPSSPAVAMITARLRARKCLIAVRSSSPLASSPSTSRQLLRAARSWLARRARANSAASSGRTSLPSGVDSSSLSSSMLCSSPEASSGLSAGAAARPPPPRPRAPSARSTAQVAASRRSIRISSLSTTGFQAITRKSAQRKGSRMDLSSTSIRMAQYAPMTQRMRNPMRSRKSCPSVRASATSMVCPARPVGTSPQASHSTLLGSPPAPVSPGSQRPGIGRAGGRGQASRRGRPAGAAPRGSGEESARGAEG